MAFGLAALLALVPAHAVDDLIIAAAGPDLNGDGNIGDDIAGDILEGQFPGADSVVTAARVSNLLGTGNLVLAAESSITVNSGVTWASFNALTLRAGDGRIAFNAPLTGGGFLNVFTTNHVSVGASIASGSQIWHVGDVVWTAGSLSGTNELSINVLGGKTANFNAINGFSWFSKSGGGTLTLTQPSNYTGQTSIGQGTLRSANTSGSATGSSQVVVRYLATLAGTGRHAGLVIVTERARLDPGSPFGTLTLSGGLRLENRAVINAALGTSSDRIVVNAGTLTGPTLPGGVTVNFSDAGGLAAGTYVLIDGRGATLSGFTASDFKVGTAPENFSFTFRLEGNILSVIVGPPAYGTGYLFTARDCRLQTNLANDPRDYDCVNFGPAGQGFLGTRQQRWNWPVGGNSGGGINSGAVSLAFEPNSGDIDASWGDGMTDHADAVVAQGLGSAPVPLGRMFGSAGFGGPLSLPVIKGYSQPSAYSRTNSNLFAFQKYTYGGTEATLVPLALDLTYVIGNHSSSDDVVINPFFPAERPGGASVSATLSVVNANAVTIVQLGQLAKTSGFNSVVCGAESFLGWPAGSILGTAVVSDRTDGGGVRQESHSKPILSCANSGQPVAITSGQEFYVTAGLQIPARGTHRQPGDPSTALIAADGYVHADNTMLAVIDPAAPPEAVQAFVANTTLECSPNCDFPSIDVKPGDALNCINPHSQGSIPVALFGSNSLSVAQVDQATLRFGSLVPTSNKSKLRCSTQRVNADDQDDLVCHFGNHASNWQVGQASETLTGATVDGDPIEASDKVCIEQ